MVYQLIFLFVQSVCSVSVATCRAWLNTKHEHHRLDTECLEIRIHRKHLDERQKLSSRFCRKQKSTHKKETDVGSDINSHTDKKSWSKL